MERRKKSNASTAQKQDALTQKKIAERIAGRERPTADRAAQLEQEAFRAGAPTYDEQEMARRSEQQKDGSWYGTREPELTDELTGETRDPSVLEAGLEAAAGERTRYAQDKGAERLERQDRKKPRNGSGNLGGDEHHRAINGETPGNER